mmetsp:Transcript_22070/g.65376  ORF Transcript_22070/g.65376 Transcript_22070/m.65376 type:complete len:306 (+) Transcript_22070:995-1912(+)
MDQSGLVKSGQALQRALQYAPHDVIRSIPPLRQRGGSPELSEDAPPGRHRRNPLGGRTGVSRQGVEARVFVDDPNRSRLGRCDLEGAVPFVGGVGIRIGQIIGQIEHAKDADVRGAHLGRRRGGSSAAHQRKESNEIGVVLGSPTLGPALDESIGAGRAPRPPGRAAQFVQSSRIPDELRLHPRRRPQFRPGQRFPHGAAVLLDEYARVHPPRPQCRSQPRPSQISPKDSDHSSAPFPRPAGLIRIQGIRSDLLFITPPRIPVPLLVDVDRVIIPIGHLVESHRSHERIQQEVVPQRESTDGASR